MISDHFNAIKARLEANPALTGKVFDTVRVDSASALVYSNYVILYRSPPESIDSGRFTAIADVDSELSFTIDLRAVGTTATAAGAVMDAVLDSLTGHRLTVTDRSCTPLKLASSSRIAPDTSVKPFLYYADVGFDLISRPA